MSNDIRRIQIPVEGNLAGWAEENETDEQAIARFILEAETAANEKGDPRLHLEPKLRRENDL